MNWISFLTNPTFWLSAAVTVIVAVLLFGG